MSPFRLALLVPLLGLPLVGVGHPTRGGQERERQEPGERRRERHEEDTELARTMESIEHAVKRLRRSLRDEEMRGEALVSLVEIERLSLDCKQMVPLAMAKVPEGERTAFVRDYRRQMIAFLTRQLELEKALLDEDEAAIKEAFDRFREMEDSSHERFAPEDE